MPNKVVKAGAKFAVTGSTALGFLFEIERAYIRTRIPLGSSYKFQLELGKNALSWGEGYFYNAGDVIFGITPKNTGSGQDVNNFRNFSLWQLRLFFPLSAFAYIETVIGVPEQILPFTKTGSTENIFAGILLPTSIDDGGAGIRTHFELGPTQIEAGLYSHIARKEISPYLSFSLPLIFKWYIVTSATFTILDDLDTKENYKKQFGKTAAISTGFLYTTSIGNSNTLDFRAEMLYQNKKIFANIFTTYSINRVIGIQLNTTLNFMDFKYWVSLGPQWIPAEGFSLLFLAHTNFEVNPNLKKSDEYIYAGLSLILSYKY